MTDGSKIGLAIVASGILVSTVLLWQNRKGPDESRGSSGPTASNMAPASSAIPAKSDPLAGVLTSVEFIPLWEAGPDDRANTECWEPAEKKGRVESVLHLDVKIRASGEVSDVTWRSRSPGEDELFGCVAKIIRGMRFSARSEAAQGTVQAAKPGAFTVGGGPPPARDR